MMIECILGARTDKVCILPCSYIISLLSLSAMWLANIVCVGMIKGWATTAAGVSLGQIWWALAAFMGVQVATGILRYQSKTGVWRALRHE